MGIRRLLIFTLALSILNLNTSCLSYKAVSIDEIKSQNVKRWEKINQQYLILKYNKNNYRLNNYSFENGYLVGNLMPYQIEAGTFIQITTKVNIIEKLKMNINNRLTLSYHEIDTYAIKTIPTEVEAEAIYYVACLFILVVALIAGEVDYLNVLSAAGK